MLEDRACTGIGKLGENAAAGELTGGLGPGEP